MLLSTALAPCTVLQTPHFGGSNAWIAQHTLHTAAKTVSTSRSGTFRCRQADRRFSRIRTRRTSLSSPSLPSTCGVHELEECLVHMLAQRA